MSDQWVKEAERRGDEIDTFSSWVEQNEDLILESWIEHLTLDDVPDDFINNMYETSSQSD